MAKVFISTHPFGSVSSQPLELLQNYGCDIKCNPFERKIQTEELAENIAGVDVLIAGTEKIDASVLERADSLKLIARVGIGLDGINFKLCREKKIRVSYTPDAPTRAVAEFSLGLMLDLLRGITRSDIGLKRGVWYRHMGELLSGKTVGIVGMGRTGKSLVHLLSVFNVKILVSEIEFDHAYAGLHDVKFVSRDELLAQSDIVSLHLPLKEDTLNYISERELRMMKKSAVLINTARGGIVNETALYDALKNGELAAAALDVFENEPYAGNLTELDNCLLTCHLGAATRQSRLDMETQAAEEVLRFLKGEKLVYEVFSDE